MQSPFQQNIKKTRTKIFTSNSHARYSDTEIDFIRDKIEEVTQGNYPNKDTRAKIVSILQRNLPLRSVTALAKMVDKQIAAIWTSPPQVMQLSQKFSKLSIR